MVIQLRILLIYAQVKTNCIELLRHWSTESLTEKNPKQPETTSQIKITVFFREKVHPKEPNQRKPVLDFFS